MSNEVKDFFNNIASSWDNMECHSTEEKKALLDRLSIHQGDKILDIACGTGVITSLIHDYSKSDVKGIDIANNMIDIAKEKYKNCPWASFQCIDFMNLNEEEKYDYAIIYNAYPHFQNPEMLASKLDKILAKNGRFAIIHSLSRHELSAHHAGAASKVSRDLLSPKLESIYFKDYFNIDIVDEGEHYYIIVGAKK